ncbi:hypothetical protein Tco_0896166 [Tanacetum coccineum]
MHQTFEKISLAMTHKFDDIIELPKSLPEKTNKEDLECEMVMVKIPRCMSWLGSTNAYDENLDSLEVEETLGTPMEVEPLDQTKLEDVGLTNHNIILNSREVPSVDGSEPQLLPNFPPLNVRLGDKRGPEPPIKPHSPDNFRMKEVDHLTIYTPPLPHVASFYPNDVYCYYHPYIDDPKKHYRFKPSLLGSLTKSFSNSEVIEDDFLEEGLSLPIKTK